MSAADVTSVEQTAPTKLPIHSQKLSVLEKSWLQPGRPCCQFSVSNFGDLSRLFLYRYLWPQNRGRLSYHTHRRVGRSVWL